LTKKRNIRAFTLVELLVVIGIVALLLGILLPSLSKARTSALKVRCMSNLKQIHLAFNLYTQAYDGIYPCAQDPLPNGQWLWMGRGWRDFIRPYLGDHIDANNPSVLYCPQDRVAIESFSATSYAYSLSFYHSPAQINLITSPSQTYGASSLLAVPQKDVSVSRPGEKIMVGEWLSNHQRIDEDKGWWCWEGSRNFLFADGHIGFVAATKMRPANDDYPNPNVTHNGISGTDWTGEKHR
jgi:prepilin-type N-terminal cleavage/methylation domain-containing protein/prepilin-type processing-associated H-X9-DG protein